MQIEDNGCLDTSACEVIDQVGIFEFDEEINWTIHPNPTSDKVTIRFHEQMGEVKVEVVNPLGQVIESRMYTDSSEIELSLGSESGLYFVTVISYTGLVSIPVVKI